MNSPRRDMLATAAVAGGMLTSTSAAMAQTGDRVLQLKPSAWNWRYRSRPNNVIRERQNPDDAQSARHGFRHDARTSVSLLPMRMCGRQAAAGPVK